MHVANLLSSSDHSVSTYRWVSRDTRGCACVATRTVWETGTCLPSRVSSCPPDHWQMYSGLGLHSNCTAMAHYMPVMPPCVVQLHSLHGVHCEDPQPSLLHQLLAHRLQGRYCAENWKEHVSSDWRTLAWLHTWWTWPCTALCCIAMSEWHTIIKCCIHNHVSMQLAILLYFCLQLYHLLLA